MPRSKTRYSLPVERLLDQLADRYMTHPWAIEQWCVLSVVLALSDHNDNTSDLESAERYLTRLLSAATELPDLIVSKQERLPV